MEDLERLKRTAYHEAGHAVMASVFKMHFKKVSIIKDEGSWGRVETGPVNENAPSFDQKRGAIIFMAGRIAGSIYSGEEISFTGCMLEAAHYGLSMHDPGETCDAFLTYIFHYTHDLIKNYWPEIEALTHELLDKNELNYSKVSALIKETRDRRLYKDKYDEQIAEDKLLRNRLKRSEVQKYLDLAKTTTGATRKRNLRIACLSLRNAYIDFIERKLFKDVVGEWRKNYIEFTLKDPFVDEAVVPRIDERMASLSKYIYNHSYSKANRAKPLIIDFVEQELQAYHSIVKDYKAAK